MNSPEAIAERPQTYDDFLSDTYKDDPVSQVLRRVSMPTAGPLILIGIKSLIGQDYETAAKTLGPAAAELGICELGFSAYRKLPQEKREIIKKSAIALRKKIDHWTGKGFRLAVDAASLFTGFILTTASIEGYGSSITTIDFNLPAALASLILLPGGVNLIHEGITGDAGRFLNGMPRKYPSLLDRFAKFYRELPKK